VTARRGQDARAHARDLASGFCKVEFKLLLLFLFLPEISRQTLRQLRLPRAPPPELHVSVIAKT
jgi:hypothetical protein